MNKRIALKVIRSANPHRRAAAYAVLAAGRRVARYARRDDSPRCADCPIGGRDENRETCVRTRTCDREAAAETLAMDVAYGRYPWGPWRCAVQVASGEGAGTPGTHRVIASLQVNGIELLPENA